MSDKTNDLAGNNNFLENASKSVKQTFDLYTSVYSDTETTKSKSDEKVESIKALNPELQNSLAKLQSTVQKDKVDKLLNRSKEQTGALFTTTGKDSLTEEQKSTVLKKLNKWESSEEINTANASVISLWMDKFGKSK